MSRLRVVGSRVSTSGGGTSRLTLLSQTKTVPPRHLGALRGLLGDPEQIRLLDFAALDPKSVARMGTLDHLGELA